MLTDSQVVELVKDELLPQFAREQQRLNRIDKWYRWHNDAVKIPQGATREHRDLRELAKVPMLGLVVTEVAQGMFVEGYRTSNQQRTEDGALRQESTGWDLWTQNDFESRQSAVHRAAVAYGTAYATALPGERLGEKSAVFRGVSPRKMLAFYENPAEDDWARYVIRKDGNGRYRVYDNELVYHLRSDKDSFVVVDIELHDVGHPPVVRYSTMDLDGRSPGEIEPNISLGMSLDKTKYDRHLIQHFNSHKVRFGTGLEAPREATEDGENAADAPVDTAAAAVARMKLANDTILLAESPDAKFGSLPETQMDGILKAFEADVKTLAAVTQTPVYALVGDLVNVSEDGIAAARASADAKLAEYQRCYGRSHSRLIRLGCHIVGDETGASDFAAGPKWADTSIRSLSAAADALGKLATMLAVPVQELWSLVPGVTQDDVLQWKVAAAATQDPLDVLTAELERAALSATSEQVA